METEACRAHNMFIISARNESNGPREASPCSVLHRVSSCSITPGRCTGDLFPLLRVDFCKNVTSLLAQGGFYTTLPRIC
eukprot:scaffold883_cov325-Pavlova_lutheri.AAC.7